MKVTPEIIAQIFASFENETSIERHDQDCKIINNCLSQGSIPRIFVIIGPHYAHHIMHVIIEAYRHGYIARVKETVQKN